MDMGTRKAKCELGSILDLSAAGLQDAGPSVGPLAHRPPSPLGIAGGQSYQIDFVTKFLLPTAQIDKALKEIFTPC